MPFLISSLITSISCSSSAIFFDANAVRESILHQAAVLKDALLVAKYLIECSYESGLNGPLIQMWSRTFLFALEFSVALPDDPAVLAAGVPYLGTKKGAAVSTNDTGSKDAFSAVLPAKRLSAFEFSLHLVKFLRRNDELIAVLHIILRHLALVDLSLFREEVHGETFL